MIEVLKSSLAAMIGAIVSITILLFQRKWQVDDQNKERDKKIFDELKKIDKKIDDVEKKLDAHVLSNEEMEQKQVERDMKQVRSRILRFESDCLNPYIPYPTEAMFLQNADDENTYKSFLISKESEGFKNGYCENAMDYIDQVNQFCKKNNLFGKMKKEII